MPEVMAARSGRDYTLSSQPSRRRGPPRQSRLGALAQGALRRPGRLIASAAFAAGAVYIVLNALAFQTARHPAPLFADPSFGAAGATASAPAPAQRAAEAVSPPPAPVVETARAPLPPARAPLAPIERAAPPAPPPAPTLVQDVDPIGALIREDTAATTASLPAVEPDLRVARVQEALIRLGHGPMTIDGLFGPATSSAIAAFERQNGLEVTGGLEPATLRALAVRSGVSVD